MTYINRKGGTQSAHLTHLAKECWSYCMKRKINLEVEHLPGHLNIIADKKFRMMKDRWDWKLHPMIFRKINYIWGPLEIDLFASRMSKQLPRFFSWMQPSNRGNQCFQAPLETTSLCQPTPGTNLKDTLRGQSTKSNGSASCPSLEISGLVPGNDKPTVRPPTSNTSTRNNSSTDPPNSASIQGRGCPTGRMVLIRRSCVEGELSEEATSLLMASWRSKSQTSYNSLFHKWERWCHSRGRDPICGPVGVIANFLAELFKEGYS